MNPITLKLNNEEAVSLIEAIQIAGGNPASPFKGEAVIAQVPDPNDEEKEEFFLTLTPSLAARSNRLLRVIEIALTGASRVGGVILVLVAANLSKGEKIGPLVFSPVTFIAILLVAGFLLVYDP